MRAGRVLLLSAVVHAALAGVLSQIVIEGKHVVAVAPPEEEPIEVAFIDPEPRSPTPHQAPDPVAGMSQPATSTSTRGPGKSQVRATPAIASAALESTSGPETGGSETGGSETGGSETSSPAGDASKGQGTSLMHMRGPELGLDPGVAQRIAEGGTHPLPGAPKVSGRLDPVSGGKAAIYDLVTTVDVEQDGTAHFHDKPDIDIHLKLPIPHIDIEGMRKDLGSLLTDWYADPDAGTRFGRSQELSNINLAAPGACDQWSSVWCDDPLAPESEKRAREQEKTKGSLAGGNADLSAYLYRKLKIGDPYASRKLKLLDDTRDERAKMGSEHHAQQLQRSAELIARNLVALERAKLPPSELRVALFELWDECAEPRLEIGADEQQDAEGQAGQRARAQVIGWIRTHLPRGSPGAFSDEEIAASDLHRTSRQHFAPYD